MVLIKMVLIKMALIKMVYIKILNFYIISKVFIKNGLHKDTKDKYDPYGFNINGKHKDTGTFLDKENYIRKDI